MTKVLLDTNIIIHREAHRATNEEIGKLFNWLDKLKYTKCIHPLTIDEIGKFQNPDIVRAMNVKMEHYTVLKTEAPLKPELADYSQKNDKSENDINDTRLVNALANERVDIIITEDKNIHRKAEFLGIGSRVFKIESFLEKVTAENPAFVDYKTLSVKKEYFGNINLQDSFFDSFRKDYPWFDQWFNRKSDELAYVCYEAGQVMAFLFLKKEDETEDYRDITPVFPRRKRLKVGTFKVMLNGYKLGERFLKIIFDNALIQRAEEIYVTIFNNTPEQERLVELLQEWGFQIWGTKKSASGKEIVLVRNFVKGFNLDNPKLSFPYFSVSTTPYLVAIYPDYHTSLLPDGVLRTESPTDFEEHEPFRNAIRKVFISRSPERNLKKGDVIIFYRTGETTPKTYSSVITTVGVVESIITDIKNEAEFIALCRKRSVFTDKELSEHWNYNKYNRPFIVNFLYNYTFPKRSKVNLKGLIDLGVIANSSSAPRGFMKISKANFEAILQATQSDEGIIVH